MPRTSKVRKQRRKPRRLINPGVDKVAFVDEGASGHDFAFFKRLDEEAEVPETEEEFVEEEVVEVEEPVPEAVKKEQHVTTLPPQKMPAFLKTTLQKLVQLANHFEKLIAIRRSRHNNEDGTREFANKEHFFNPIGLMKHEEADLFEKLLKVFGPYPYPFPRPGFQRAVSKVGHPEEEKPKITKQPPEEEKPKLPEEEKPKLPEETEKQLPEEEKPKLPEEEKLKPMVKGEDESDSELAGVLSDLSEAVDQL